MAKQPILSGTVVRERPMCTLNPSTRQWRLLMMTVANDRARVAQNDETIENLKRNRRQDKQIDRRDAVDPTAMNIFDARPDPSYGTGAIV